MHKWLSIIVGDEVSVQENVKGFMELLVCQGFVHKLTPFVWIDKHFITS